MSNFCSFFSLSTNKDTFVIPHHTRLQTSYNKPQTQNTETHKKNLNGAATTTFELHNQT